MDDRPTTAIADVDQRWAGRIQFGDGAQLLPHDRSGPERIGRVTALGPSITELPERLRRFPDAREYGRSIFIKFEAAASLAGQSFDVTFRAGPRAQP